MRKVIKGKLYNTETAEELASDSNGQTPGSFEYSVETVYRTKSGAFFMYGHGGAMSRYKDFAQGMYTSGSRIIEMTTEEVIAWFARHEIDPSPIEKYIAIPAA